MTKAPELKPSPEAFQQMREALEKIACRHVTESPLWWQELARAALKAAEGE